MQIKYLLIAAVIIVIALSAYAVQRYVISGQKVVYNSSTAPRLGHFSQRFCLNAASNASALQFAVHNSVHCFRTDIFLNSNSMRSVSDITSAGAGYLGILDYDTVGAQPSRNGCISGCNWSLNTWNASVANAILDYPGIHEWEIYNEPLIPLFQSGYDNGSALNYFNMIKSAYIIIKGKDPNATIVCLGGPQLFPGGTLQVEYPFYQKAWAYGASKYCDAVSLHVYSLPFYSVNQTLFGNVTLAAAYNYTLGLYENLTEKPVWITETGIPSNNWTIGANMSEQKQAVFLAQDLHLFASHSFVKRVYWFNLVGGIGTGADFGLLNATTLRPKPSWKVFSYFLSNSG